MGAEKRKYPRRDLGLAATVTWPPAMPCLIADISQTGGRLRLSNMHRLPDEFDLALNEDIMRKCRVVWRTKTEIGVKFLSTSSVRE